MNQNSGDDRPGTRAPLRHHSFGCHQSIATEAQASPPLIDEGMDEIEFLIFRKLVETDQLAHMVKGWSVWLEFPELDLEIMYERGQATLIWGRKSAQVKVISAA